MYNSGCDIVYQVQMVQWECLTYAISSTLPLYTRTLNIIHCYVWAGINKIRTT